MPIACSVVVAKKFKSKNAAALRSQSPSARVVL